MRLSCDYPFMVRLLRSCMRLSSGIDIFAATPSPPTDFDWEHRIRNIEEISNKANEWMETCQSTHRCRGTSGNLPSRVLSVDSDTVRLCDGSGKSGAYAALSHCWGTQPILTTTKSTLELHKHAVDWSQLGKTFQDAITLTRSLGIAYIWIDCLCIVQDSVEDWETESAQMASIYQNSTITIAASKAADGSVGLFPNQSEIPYIWRRNPHAKNNVDDKHAQNNDSDETQSPFIYIQHRNQWQPFPIRSTTSDNSFWMSLEPSHGVLTHQRRRPPSDVVGFGMPLFTRAWFLQERLMSPRIIHFGVMELLWECDHGLRCECKSEATHQVYSQANARALYAKLLRSPRSRKPRSLDPNISSRKGQWMVKSNRDLLPWHDLVEEYSRLLLTRETDRLPALSGIANLLSNHYLAGLWTDLLPRCLYWTVDTTCNVFPARPFQHRAPSFSWASVEAPINYHDWFKDLDTSGSNASGHVVSTILNVGPGLVTNNDQITLLGYTGLAIISDICTFGPSTQCTISHNNLTQSFQLDIPICLARQAPTEVRVNETVTLLLLECVKRTDAYRIRIYGQYAITALVLTPGPEGSRTYHRIGIISPLDSDEAEKRGYKAVEEQGNGMHTSAPGWFSGKREVSVV